MINDYPRFTVLVTHIPTNLSAMVDSWTAKTITEAKTTALKLVRSRVYAQQNGLLPDENVVADYELPDKVPYPDNLFRYRKG